MEHSNASRQADFLKPIKAQIYLTALVAVLLLSAVVYYLIQSTVIFPKPDTKEMKFKTPVSDADAEGAIENYSNLIRNLPVNNFRGVIYDAATIREFLDVKLPAVQQRHTAHRTGLGKPDATTEGMEWKLAFYLMNKTVGEGAAKKNAISFFVVPVLVEKTTGKVLDYFRISNREYYASPSSKPNGGDSSEYNVFDEGQLWP